jgi:hypothetical protein
VRPTLGYFPLLIQQILSWIAIVASSLWVAKTWHRSAQKYNRERDANLLKRQLGKLDIDLYQALEGRSLDDLNPDELYALAKVLPGFTQANRLQVYQGILREAFEQQSIAPAKSLRAFQPMRQSLGIDEETHWVVINKLQLEEPLLFARHRWQIQDSNTTVYRSANDSKNLKEANLHTSADTEPTVRSSNSVNRNSVGNRDLDPTVVKPLDDTSNEKND